MIKVCIIEDDKSEQDRLRDYLRRYGEANDCDFAVTAYESADTFIENRSADFDILFLDIELPGTNGMTAAKRIREKDADVVIIFVTNVAKLAIDGYSVQALDYIIKPIDKYPFFATMNRAVRKVRSRRGIQIGVNTSDGIVFLNSDDILYVEAFGHKLVYHTGNGEVCEWASLLKPEKTFEGFGFARCHKCYLVNLRYVESFAGGEITVGGVTLKVSYTKAKDFARALNEYLCK